MGGPAQALKRIPRIKFPPRHPKPSGAGSASGTQATASSVNPPQGFFSRPPSMTPGGKASDQPKRTPLSQEEIEAILLGGSGL
ncbi:OLC1v1030027C1 [Oldenlandia corymbosa var. corymbosa]|uniref:OLC1v1030027C1 n=1 Tax=Oldenlandia corymbosa var. corymbosa TaxID=529605 RepID=A0AAV1CF14_OLDCO|nr:OLC1v1030027C1 [Oldenlandia corymbosa var. corymbosa]